jgi:hypothetical protein
MTDGKWTRPNLTMLNYGPRPWLLHVMLSGHLGGPHLGLHLRLHRPRHLWLHWSRLRSRLRSNLFLIIILWWRLSSGDGGTQSHCKHRKQTSIK